MRRRWWLGFGDLAVGERFVFLYGLGGATSRRSPVMVKVSARRYQDAEGRKWGTGQGTAVERAAAAGVRS